MPKVAIIGPIDELGRNTIKVTLGDDFEIVSIDSEAEYPEKLPYIDYAVLRTLTLKNSIIERCHNLKLIQRWGVGYDSVDIVAAGAKNIPVAVLPGANAVAVAEYAILLMLCAMRNIVKVHTNIVNGLVREEALTTRSYVLSSKTVGLIGLGSIGKNVAALVQGFGADVVYYDQHRLSVEQEISLGLIYLPLNELAACSDVISLHVPLVESTRKMINRDIISLMKPTAVLINTARGGIIDEQALFEALRDGRILAAGLDVFEYEPLAKGHPFTGLNNVVLSAHCAGSTMDNSLIMGKLCAENILQVHRGIRLTRPVLVNEEYLCKRRS